MTALSIELKGEEFLLHPQRVMIWPRLKSLIAADLHFGKGAWFRRQGIAVPTGSSSEDLARLSALIEEFHIEQLLLLGDLFHHKPSQVEPFQQAFEPWRQRHAALAIVGIVGNHDRHGAEHLFGSAVEWLPEYREKGFVFRHEPEVDREAYVLAGHLHPVLTLSDGRDRLRAPVFWLRADYGVLPSFGSLTGGHSIRPGPGDRIFLVGPNQVTSCEP